MKRHRSGIAGLAVLAAVAALPVVVSAYRRGRGNYTTTAEFRALVGDYLI
jgi:ABC-type transporter Mla subunit MlaD